MRERSRIKTVALAMGMLLTSPAAHAFEDGKYPDLRGAWNRTVPNMPRFDSSKPRGLGQQAPLKAEFQARFEASLADQADGGQGDHVGYACMPWGMPAMMNAYDAMEIVVLPETTFIMIDDLIDAKRRIFTDGRDWPTDVAPTFSGYSIGRWIDSSGAGRYDLLEVETRDLKGPRVYDNTGLALHPDNQSVIKERIYLDKVDPNLLHNDITVIDNALTRPWTVNKTYRRDLDPQPNWIENVCAEGNTHIRVGEESYMLSADGLLMPAKKDQAPPDLQYFRQPPK